MIADGPKTADWLRRVLRGGEDPAQREAGVPTEPGFDAIFRLGGLDRLRSVSIRLEIADQIFPYSLLYAHCK
jgi:hypothetical protein